jgi:O-antigen ligase
VLIPALALAGHGAIGNFRRYCLHIITLLITVGLILSVSISGFIAALISFFICGIMSRIKLKKIAIFLSICAVSILTVYFSIKHGGISVFDRLGNIAEQKLYYETSASRLEVYRLAWESISNNPVVGVGMGPYAGITETGDAVHNVILLNWYESGVLVAWCIDNIWVVDYCWNYYNQILTF